MDDSRYNAQFDGANSRGGGPGSSDALKQALRSLGGGSGAIPSVGSLSPEQLTELAQRAGLPVPGADLSRVMGNAAAAAGVAPVAQFIVFALDTAECALPGDAVQGVERIVEITPIPNTAPWVLGIIHLRGSILSVVDLRAFLGMPSQPLSQGSRLLVVAQREMLIGFLVDGVTELRPQDDLLNAPTIPAPDWIAPYARGAARVDGRTIILFDPERLLSSEKIHQYQAEG